MFVVSGLVRNDYDHPVRYIRLEGLLHDAPDAPPLRRGVVYAGNPLAEEEIRQLSEEELNLILNNRSGKSEMGERVPSGESIPFTLLFKDLPPEMKEYTVKVMDSQPCQAENVATSHGYQPVNRTQVPNAPATNPSGGASSGKRFTETPNGIIADHETGLEWFVGPDKNTTWYEAERWVANLTLDGGGCRMPTVAELKGIYEKGVGSRNLNPLFETSGWWIWSGEVISPSSASDLEFNSGIENSKNRDFSVLHRSFAVRFPADKADTVRQERREHEQVKEWRRLTKASNGIITDHQTGLEWFFGPDVDTTWDKAKQWVAGLSTGGGGWRLPMISEVKDLFEKRESLYSIHSLLSTTGSFVWIGSLSERILLLFCL